MASARISKVFNHFQQALFSPNGGGPTDGQLLEAFLTRRDEAAFEAIVRRHGPMVLGVCRRVLRNGHDAEDAFQATFLVLVRKAARVVPREKVGNWLHGVAYRTALEARAAAARRQAKERKATAMAEQARAEPKPPDDVRAILDEEIDRLPEKYRVAVVLCELEGRSRREAARQLGWPEGTLSSRLATARRMLGKRLKGRGLAVGAGTLTSAWMNQATAAALPGPLIGATVTAAQALMAGQAVVVSAEVAALTEGVVKAMFLTKLKVVSTVAVTVTLFGLLTGAGAYQTWAADDKDERKPPAQAADNKDNRRPPAQVEVPKPFAVKSGNETAKNPLSPGGGLVPAAVGLSADQNYLRFRTNVPAYEQVTTLLDDGQMVTSYRQSHRQFIENYPVKRVKVYKVKGSDIEYQAISDLPDLLPGSETRVLISRAGSDIDPGYLPLLKDGTLLFALPVLPAPKASLPAAAVAPPYQPVPPPEVVTPLTPPATSEGVSPAPAAGWPSSAFKLEMAELEKEIKRLKQQNQRLLEAIRDGSKGEDTINTRYFKIPYQIENKYQREIHEVRLYVSLDQGKSWELAAVRTVGDDLMTSGGFDFFAPKDGVYWFTVQMKMRDGTLSPTEIRAGQRPHRKVRVDTSPRPPAKNEKPATPFSD